MGTHTQGIGNGGPGQTVFNDDEDQLTGSAGLDWFLANGVADNFDGDGAFQAGEEPARRGDSEVPPERIPEFFRTS